MKKTIYVVLIVTFSAISWVGAMSAWGQYSSADCTGPQTIGTDTISAGTRTCTNGILFTASDIPRGPMRT